jgi:flagellar motor protein MotB
MSAWIRWILLLSAVYFAAASYWYVVHHKNSGQQRPQASAVISKAAPISFNFRSGDALTSEEFPTFQRELIAQGRDEQALMITGLYFADEDNQQLPNVGELRANGAMRLFETALALERIKTQNRRVESKAPSQNTPFEALEFSWVALAAPVPRIAMDTPLSFNIGSAEAITSAEFPAFKTSFGKAMPQQLFEITGVWYASESTDPNVDLGLQRARAAQALFADVMRTEQTILRSLRLDEAAPAAPFAAVRFRFIDSGVPAAPGPTALTIYFATGAANTVLDAETNAQLQAFVAAAQGKTVLVSGHTDITGNVAKNQKLASERAEYLANALRSAGLQSEIKTATMASENPVGDNSTDAGRRQNRRAEASLQ